jgi:ribosomal protein S27E
MGATGVTKLKCPGCGAPIVPKANEVVITCEFCGSSITLGNEGWTNVKNHTMLVFKYYERESVLTQIGKEMDKGIFHRHLQEQSKLEEATLAVVPYWIVPVSARTKVTFLWKEENRQAIRKTEEVDENYEYPVVAIKALGEYQPKDFHFALNERTLFDGSKIPKSVKVLNGDVDEETAKAQAKTLVSQLQYQKAHEVHRFHTIEQLDTQIDVTEGELLHAPVWDVRYNHDGKKIVFIVDANTGGMINSIGL